MKRMMLAGVLLAGLLPAIGQAADYPIGFWRWMGYGIGPGYHAHNCCNGATAPRRPQIVPWQPHVAEVSNPAENALARGQEGGSELRAAVRPSVEVQPQDDPWQAIRPMPLNNPLR